jgi:ATP-dependent Clp protease ATP-binding subunit ClpC
MKDFFRPEFINRLNEIIIFEKLTEQDIAQIAVLLTKELIERLKEQYIQLEISPTAVKLLAKRGYDERLGARPLRRLIERELEDVLSEKILLGEIASEDKVIVAVSEETLVFKTKKHESSFKRHAQPPLELLHFPKPTLLTYEEPIEESIERPKPSAATRQKFHTRRRVSQRYGKASTNR